MRHFIHLVPLLVTGVLPGCGLSDSHSTFVPASFRQPEAPARQAEPEPDVHALVQAELAELFTESSHPSNIRVSPPRPGIVGVTWNACIKANVMGMSGASIGTQTLLIEIAGGKIRDRRRDERGVCAQVAYEPL